MPSFLFKSEILTPPSYNHPLELAGKALLYRDSKYKEGISVIRNKYDSILSYKTSNPENTEFLQTGIQQSLSNLDKLAGADLSLPGNVSAGLKSFDNITNNKALRDDIAFTQSYNTAMADARSTGKKDPNSVAVQNLDLITSAMDDYMKTKPQSDPDATPPTPVRFIPHYNFEKIQADKISKIKADIEIQKKDVNYQAVIGGRTVNLSTATQQEIESLTKSRIATVIYNDFNTDSQAKNQLMIDHRYNTKYGLYDLKETKEDLKSNVEALEYRINELTDLGKLPNITQTQKSESEKIIKDLQAQVTSISGRLRSMDDPNYKFTPSDHMEAYVNKMYKLYGYTKEHKIESMPGSTEVLKLQSDVILKGFEAQLEAIKTTNEEAKNSPVNPDGSPGADVSVKLYHTLEELEQSPSGTAYLDNTGVAALVGGVYNKDSGDITLNITPSTGVILVPGEAATTSTNVQSAVLVNQYRTELAKFNTNHQIDKLTATGKGLKNILHNYNDEDLVKLYFEAKRKNSNNQQLTKPEQDVLKFNSIFDKLNINTNNTPQDALGRLAAQYKIVDGDNKNTAEATKIGVKLNQNYSQSAVIIPTNKPIVAMGDSPNGLKLGVTAAMLIPSTALGNGGLGVSVDELLSIGAKVSNHIPKMSPTTSNENAASNVKWYSMNVVIPVEKPLYDVAKDIASTDLEGRTGKDATKRIQNSVDFYNTYNEVIRQGGKERPQDIAASNKYMDPQVRELKETRYERSIRLMVDRQLKISDSNVGSVSLKHVSPQLKSIVSNLQNVLFPDKNIGITSANDQSNRLKRSTKSLHRSGYAIDLKYDKDVYDYLVANPDILGSFEVIPPDHGTAPHIHIQLKKQFRND
jgi:hypothetical protein